MKVLVLLCFVGLSSALWSRKKQMEVSGCLKCDNQPIPYVKVHLYDNRWIGRGRRLATSRTGVNGCFRMSGKGRKAYVSVEYQYSGTYGNMEVENSLGWNRRDKTSTRKAQSNINYGVVNFSGTNCKTYNVFYTALVNYKQRTSMALPYKTLNVKTNYWLHGGTPYALLSQVRIPRNYRHIDVSMALHELAHTLRHSLDGNMAHFLYDVMRYRYMRSHTCSTRSNHGYAFNEGWAEFWAGDCNGVYGASPADYSVEGNVAKALRRLMNRCNSSYRNFVLVLKSTKVHSFGDFNKGHERLFRCRL